MNATKRNRTFKDGIGRGSIRQAIHGSSESNKMQFIFWPLNPAPGIFLDIVCFVKGGLGWFIGMRKLRVKKSLSKITGGLEAHVEAVEAH